MNGEIFYEDVCISATYSTCKSLLDKGLWNPTYFVHYDTDDGRIFVPRDSVKGDIKAGVPAYMVYENTGFGLLELIAGQFSIGNSSYEWELYPVIPKSGEPKYRFNIEGITDKYIFEDRNMHEVVARSFLFLIEKNVFIVDPAGEIVINKNPETIDIDL